MEIFIDESGTFAVNGAPSNSWCVVVAYVCPETEKRKYQKVLTDLKLRGRLTASEEIKLHQVEENSYFQFLNDLSSLNGILLCTATDSSLNHNDLVKKHQKDQALLMLENIDKMKYESGKDGVKILTSQLENLPVQLYIQLTCQIQLMHSFVIRGISYFVQRNPNSLRNFRWKIDQKEPSKKIDFEYAFERFSPALLQSFSLDEPTPLLSWCDYRPMSDYIYRKRETPEYLIQKFPHLENKRAFDLQKIIRKDIQFVDSKSYLGIQVSDLLASGLRRLLKQGFKDNNTAARYLGKLMVQEIHNRPPIKLVTFGSEQKLDNEIADLVKVLIKSCRPMIKNS